MFGTILALIFATLLLVLRLCIYLKAKKKRRQIKNEPPAVKARKHAYLTAAKRIRTVELEGKGGKVWMDLCYDEVDEETLDLDDLSYRVRAEIGREGKMSHYKDFWCLTLDQVEAFLDALKSLYESGEGEAKLVDSIENHLLVKADPAAGITVELYESEEEKAHLFKTDRELLARFVRQLETLSRI